MNAQPVDREITDNEYKDVLDELYPELNIGDLTFYPGNVLKEMDPTAFDIGKSEYEDELDTEEWECSECHSIFDSEDEAEECCEDED